MKKHIPNLLTSLSLFSGSIATVMAFQGEYLWVVIWVIIAAIFDFSDGFSARLLKAYSPMGKELDSLSDMVSFGVAPSIAVYTFLSGNLYIITENDIIKEYLPYMAFLLTIFSALRLAKFNIDERQSESFVGLNTPANAMFWVSFCYSLGAGQPLIAPTPSLIYLLLIAIVVFSLLMVSEIPMFSLKVKSLKLKGNEYRYFLALSVIILIAFFKIAGIAIAILLYIALSIISSKKQKA